MIGLFSNHDHLQLTLRDLLLSHSKFVNKWYFKFDFFCPLIIKNVTDLKSGDINDANTRLIKSPPELGPAEANYREKMDFHDL